MDLTDELSYCNFKLVEKGLIVALSGRGPEQGSRSIFTLCYNLPDARCNGRDVWTQT